MRKTITLPSNLIVGYTFGPLNADASYYKTYKDAVESRKYNWGKCYNPFELNKEMPIRKCVFQKEYEFGSEYLVPIMTYNKYVESVVNKKTDIINI